jgi:CheY-like chemotaxis protein
MEGTGQNLLDEPDVRAIAINFRDVTERKELERQRALVARGEKMRAIGQMAGGIAHDLNQSLALIAGYGEIAGRAVAGDEHDTAMLREALDTMSSAAMNGGETVKRLLTFARTNPDGAPEPVHVAAVLREVAQLTAPHWRDAAQAEGRAISLHVESDGDAVVEGWAPSLREALTNLVLNAVDALPSGGTIRLAARHAGDRVVVEVVDSGVGMPPAVRERIFEPFFTTKGERGTGLGLAMVFGIVERHGGTVAVESAPGRGTAFQLAFPAAAPSVTAAAPVEAAPVTTLRILAVDDEPRLSRMVALMLGQAGHRVATAASGEEALERLEREPFDLVISDLGMGEGMTGWELADAVRRRWPRVRVALATGWGAQIDPDEARSRGVSGVLSKPFGGAALTELLSSV